MTDHRGHRDRLLAVDGRCDIGELGKGLLRYRLHEHVQEAATGQPDGEGVVVADAVAL
jgi:hypothetical protein